jgi:4-hydroxy-tetrahydrodipicolinate synthase
MKAVKNNLNGVCPILPTPFDDDNKIDIESLKRVVRFLIESGVNGIALFGNASEAFALTNAEEALIADIVAKEVAGRVALVFGAGGTSTETAIESCHWAESAGADILMIMPPYMIKPDAQRVYEYYAAIAANVQHPVMIQDAPNACGVTISVNTMIKLANDCEMIQYIKAEAPPTFLKAKEIIDSLGDKVSVFGGMNATFFYEELCAGVVGTMPAGEFPEVLVKVWNMYVEGNSSEAKTIFYKYLPFIRLGAIPGGMAMAVHKEILRRGGIFSTNKVRGPYIPASVQLIDLITDITKDMDLAALNRSNGHNN